MSKTIILIINVALFFILGCAGESPAPAVPPVSFIPDKKPVKTVNFTPISKVMSAEVFPEKITLDFFSEPVKISRQTYAKLTGVVVGKDSLALFSLGASTCILKTGEKIGNYSLTRVEKDSVLLKKCNEK